MYRPSGDQRGLNSPSDPGTFSILPVCKSRILMISPPPFCRKSPNINRFPSVDQLASIWLPLSARTSRGVPPAAGTRKSFQDCPGCMPTNAICFPLGDQTGNADRPGTEVNCRRSVPSARLRHSDPSGTVTYVTHLPSGENERSVAETPGITGMNFLPATSYFTISPTGCTPIAHIFLSLRAREAFPNDMEPLVRRTIPNPSSFVSGAELGNAHSALRFVLVFGNVSDAWKM